MYNSPEHAVAVAYLMLALPIEGKNNTQKVIEQLRLRHDPTYVEKPLSGMTPHEHHAQAVFILQLVKRVLRDSPMFHATQAKFGTGREGAESARHISIWINPNAETGRERELTDLIVTNILRGYPRQRQLADRFDVSKGNISRAVSAYRILIDGLVRTAMLRLECHMQDAGLLRPPETAQKNA